MSASVRPAAVVRKIAQEPDSRNDGDSMNRFRHCSGVAALLAIIGINDGAAQTPTVADFYTGKKVRMLVGYGVGTGNDLYMRLLARHIGKHIPGRPTIVPENMPGAGSMVMMNY